MRHSTIPTAFAAIATLILALPALAGDRLVDSLVDETELWLDDCGHAMTAKQASRACPLERVTFLEDLPISDDLLDAIYDLLDAEPFTADTGVVRALGVVDTVPYDFSEPSATELILLPEFEWPHDVPGLLIVFAEQDLDLSTDPDSLNVIMATDFDPAD